jgi:hypothetical protein
MQNDWLDDRPGSLHIPIKRDRDVRATHLLSHALFGKPLFALRVNAEQMPLRITL